MHSRVEYLPTPHCAFWKWTYLQPLTFRTFDSIIRRVAARCSLQVAPFYIRRCSFFSRLFLSGLSTGSPKKTLSAEVYIESTFGGRS